MSKVFSLAIILSATALCFGETSPAAAFRDFLKWYPTYQGSFLPPEVLKAYTAKLTADGLSPTDIAATVASVQKSVGAMPREFASVHFDRLYTVSPASFRDTPTVFLAHVVEGRNPGKALDVAMGQGRNSLYLAGRGWDVTGYDISEHGIALAQQAAAKARLKINTVVASHDEFNYGVAQWDLIVEAFAFTNLNDPAYRKRLVDSLKPGGLLVIEGFGNPTPGAAPNPLLEAFKSLRLVCYEDVDDVSDWGLQKMRLTRIAVENTIIPDVHK